MVPIATFDDWRLNWYVGAINVAKLIQKIDFTFFFFFGGVYPTSMWMLYANFEISTTGELPPGSEDRSRFGILAYTPVFLSHNHPYYI